MSGAGVGVGTGVGAGVGATVNVGTVTGMPRVRGATCGTGTGALETGAPDKGVERSTRWCRVGATVSCEARGGTERTGRAAARAGGAAAAGTTPRPSAVSAIVVPSHSGVRFILPVQRPRTGRATHCAEPLHAYQNRRPGRYITGGVLSRKG